MIIIELTYKKSLEVVSQFLEAHNRFLKKYYDQAIFLASGPKQPRDGGIILATGSKDEILQLIKEDPFYQQAIADYRVTEFNPTKAAPHLEVLTQYEARS